MNTLLLAVALAGAALSSKPAEPELLAEEVGKLEADNLDNAVHAAMADAARTHARLRRLLADGAAQLRRAPLKDDEAEDAELAAELLERKAAAYAARASSVSARLVELDWQAEGQSLRSERNRQGDLAGVGRVLARARARWGDRPESQAERALFTELDSALSELRAGAGLVPSLKVRAEAASGERELLARQLELSRFIDR